MDVTFYGAVREVTGSMHLLAAAEDRILLDCGMFQGRREKSNQKNRTLPFDPRILANVVLSHAHIDHSGRIPLLAKNDFTGNIVCTRVTAHACEYLLPDSAHIQESDADYLNYKQVRSLLSEMTGKKVDALKTALKKDGPRLNREIIDDLIGKYRLERIVPLYTTADADAALTAFAGQPYHQPVEIGRGVTCTFYEAGHIMGSAFSVIRAEENGAHYTVGYTGDIGRFGKPIIKDPELAFAEEHRNLDLLIMESTYGNRTHEPVQDIRPRLKQVINETVDRGGALVIPSFAFGRTQEILYVIHDLYDQKETPRVPVYVDSPLATKLTRVFGEHPEVYDQQTHRDFLQDGKNPFMFDNLHFTASVEDSMALMRDDKPHIVISASGMCEAGRILHHLRYKIHNEKNAILVVGYMAANTLGRRILEKGTEYEAGGRKGDPPVLRFMNKEYPLKAHVHNLDGFSAHADRDEMVRFLKKSNLNIKKIALVHGEEDQTLAFADHLRSEGYSVFVPKVGESLRIRP